MTANWTKYSSPVYATADGQLIGCILTVPDLGDIPFGASPNDPEQYGRDIFAAIIANADTVPIAPYVPPPPPSLAVLATAALRQGLTISSTQAPDFNATYSVDDLSQGKIGAISTYILVNGKFPGGLATYPWIDMAGNRHVFPSTAMFQKFATAVADYVAALDMIIATSSGALPDASVTLS